MAWPGHPRTCDILSMYFKRIIQIVGLGSAVWVALFVARTCEQDDMSDAVEQMLRSDQRTDSLLRVQQVRREDLLGRRKEVQRARRSLVKEYRKTDAHYDRQQQRLDTTSQRLDTVFVALFEQLRAKLSARQGGIRGERCLHIRPIRSGR